jgi:hypothetical protein
MPFMGYGMLLAGLPGDLQGGSKMADYALLLLEQLKNIRDVVSGTKSRAYGLVLPWTRPAQLSFKPLLEGKRFLFYRTPQS